MSPLTSQVFRKNEQFTVFRHINAGYTLSLATADFLFFFLFFFFLEKFIALHRKLKFFLIECEHLWPDISFFKTYFTVISNLYNIPRTGQRTHIFITQISLLTFSYNFLIVSSLPLILLSLYSHTLRLFWRFLGRGGLRLKGTDMILQCFLSTLAFPRDEDMSPRSLSITT